MTKYRIKRVYNPGPYPYRYYPQEKRFFRWHNVFTGWHPQSGDQYFGTLQQAQEALCRHCQELKTPPVHYYDFNVCNDCLGNLE